MNGRGVLDDRLGEPLAEVPDELEFARQPPVPQVQRHRVLERGELLGRVLARQLLGLERRVENGARSGEAGERGRELLDRGDAFDARDGLGVSDEVEADPLVAGGGVGDGEEERAGLRPAVDDERGVRDLDAGEVHHVVVLEELAAGRQRGAEQDGDAVGDLLDELRAPRGVLGLVEEERPGRESRGGECEDEEQRPAAHERRSGGSLRSDEHRRRIRNHQDLETVPASRSYTSITSRQHLRNAVVLPDGVEAGRAQLPAPLGILPQRRDAGREAVEVAVIHEDAAARRLHHLGERADARLHDGHAARHRLEQELPLLGGVRETEPRGRSAPAGTRSSPARSSAPRYSNWSASPHAAIFFSIVGQVALVLRRQVAGRRRAGSAGSRAGTAAAGTPRTARAAPSRARRAPGSRW